MKTLLASCLLAALPLLASAQMVNSLDAPAKPKPIAPIVAAEHAGTGRIGVRLDFPKDTGLPVIVNMTRGGPAADYGFHIGDVIVKIDRNYTDSLTPDEVRLALHGEPGSGVELTVKRGDDPLLIVHSIKRRPITIYDQDILEPMATETKS
jgi:C-terminal processing protease CtpA/Prc